MHLNEGLQYVRISFYSSLIIVDRGKWRKYNPYNPYVEEDEKKEVTKIEQLDDLFSDEEPKEESPKTEASKEIKSEAPKQEENKNIDPLDMPMQLPLEPIETPKEEPKKEIVDIQKGRILHLNEGLQYVRISFYSSLIIKKY